jgi:hypothetical protein
VSCFTAYENRCSAGLQACRVGQTELLSNVVDRPLS